ncbi:MAG: lysophospholipid acyltransferase family protein [Candidatus Omnitrophota bacterium]
MFYWFVQITIHFLAKALFRLEAAGLENIPRKGGFILASNHRSHLDPPMVTVCISRKLYFLAKIELFKSQFFAKILKGLDCIELDRDGIGRSALKEGLRVLHRGRGLLIFPEGTRSKDGRLGFGKAGASVFAFGAGVPVIPTFISGSERAMPPKRHFITPDKIKVTFGKGLVPPKVIKKEDRKQAYQKFADRIMQEIANLEKEET